MFYCAGVEETAALWKKQLRAGRHRALRSLISYEGTLEESADLFPLKYKSAAMRWSTEKGKKLGLGE